jgi:hypothetical protein
MKYINNNNFEIDLTTIKETFKIAAEFIWTGWKNEFLENNLYSNLNINSCESGTTTKGKIV